MANDLAVAAEFLEALYSALSRAGVQKPQCDFDEARGCLVINVGKGSDGTTRVLPVVALAPLYAAASGDNARAELLEAVTEAFGQGTADVPREYGACGERLLPQLWPAGKISSWESALPGGAELPHCGLHGEKPPLLPPQLRATSAGGGEDAQTLGVVLVCEYVSSHASTPAARLPIETPVLSTDLKRWGISFKEALGQALENLRARTKAGPAPEKRWEHHASGCAQSSWSDRFDSARAALLPALVARRKRKDGEPEQGGHVVAFAKPGCVLASTSKNALGLCFMGDTLYTKLPSSSSSAPGAGPSQVLSKVPYRLMKMKDKDDSGEGNPLNQKAGEGLVWRWLPYLPSGPPLKTPGEFSVPVDAGEVEAILNAAEAGKRVPVFGNEGVDTGSSPSSQQETFAMKKEAANALFKAGEYVKAIAAYDAALNIRPVPSDTEAAVAHTNAAQALLKLADSDEPRRGPCAAEALRRAVRAGELDPSYAKAHIRCAAACDMLGEKEAAEEFRQRAEACSHPAAASSSWAPPAAPTAKA